MTDILEQMCGSSLWAITLPFTEPDFSFCFQYTVMIWVPCVFVWFLTPSWIYMIKRKRKFVSKKSWLTFSKLVKKFLRNLIHFLKFFGKKMFTVKFVNKLKIFHFFFKLISLILFWIINDPYFNVAYNVTTIFIFVFKIFIILLIAIEIVNLVFSAIDALKPSDVKPILFVTPTILIATYVIIKETCIFFHN